MNKTVHLFLALATFASLNAWAAPGTQFGATSDYKNPKDTKGLCTSDNKDEFYYKFGLCESLAQFFRKPCMQDLLEQMRKSMVKPEDGKSFSLGRLECSGKSDANGQSGSIDGKNKAAFDNIIMQFIAASVIQESNWDTLNGLQNTANANHDGKTGGLLNLTNRKIFDDPANACGCRTINSNGQAGNGKSPGDKDGFQSLNCGAYVALKQAQKDGTLLDGEKSKSKSVLANGPAPASAGGSPDDANKPKGAAVYFTSLQEEGTPKPPSTDPNDPGFNNPKLNNLVYKMKTYCQSALSGNGSLRDMGTRCPQDLGGICSEPLGSGSAAH
jgi:hypothetical protein